MAALGADQKGSKEEHPPGGVGLCVIRQELLHIFVQVTGDDGRAEVGVHSPIAFIVTDIERLTKIPAATDVVPVQAVSPLNIGTDGDGRAIMLESVQNDCCIFGNDLQALFLVDPVAEGDFTGNDRSALYLTIQNCADSLPAQVRFILRNGKTDCNIQSPSRRGGVVLLLGGQPAAVVGLQDLQDLVIIRYVAKPAVQTGKEDQVKPILLHVLQHPQKVGALVQSFAGRLCRVDIHIGNHPAPFPGILLQVLLLGLQRQTFDCLFLAADADIQTDAEWGHLVFSHK